MYLPGVQFLLLLLYKFPRALGKIYTLMCIVGTFRKNIRKRGQVKQNFTCVSAD